jgi:hypothetical protein
MNSASHRPWLELATALLGQVDDLERALSQALCHSNPEVTEAFHAARAYALRALSREQWSREVATALAVIATQGLLCAPDDQSWRDHAGGILAIEAPALYGWLGPLMEPGGPIEESLAALERALRGFSQQTPDRLPPKDTLPYLQEALSEVDGGQRRRRLGIYYTPRPLAEFILRSVDRVLIESFDIEEGWLDLPSQWSVLDPSMGSGVFATALVELVLRRARHRVQMAGLSTEDVRDAMATAWNERLRPRLCGYEIGLSALVLAHLELARHLGEHGLSSNGAVDFRWANPLDEHFGPGLLHSPGPWIVVGNPPYRSVSNNRNPWLDAMLADYRRTTDGEMQERGNRNQLQDDYVKFLRIADEMTRHRGIVAMVTNRSFHEGPWFRGMRCQLLEGTSRIDLLDLHGETTSHRRKGPRDENVFPIATPVAVTILARGAPVRVPKVRYGELRGRRADKLEALEQATVSTLCVEALAPSSTNYWQFLPVDGDQHREWRDWIPLPELFVSWGAGVLTNRNGLAIDVDPEALKRKIRRFADLDLSTSAIEAEYGFGSNYKWDTETVRQRFSAHPFEAHRLAPYLFRPFDRRWIYWHPDIVYNMRGDKLEALRSPGRTVALMFSRHTRRERYTNVFVTDCLADRDCLEKANIAPLHMLAPHADGLISNVRPEVMNRLRERVPGSSEEDLFHYVYALLWSDTYRTRYHGRLRLEFPRIPLPASPELFEDLKALGEQLVAVHLDGQGTSSPAAELAPRSAPCWDVEIGGYPVLRKYARSRGLQLDRRVDRTALEKIQGAIMTTLNLVAEVDACIDACGGWPAGFSM